LNLLESWTPTHCTNQGNNTSTNNDSNHAGASDTCLYNRLPKIKGKHIGAATTLTTTGDSVASVAQPGADGASISNTTTTTQKPGCGGGQQRGVAPTLQKQGTIILQLGELVHDDADVLVRSLTDGAAPIRYTLLQSGTITPNHVLPQDAPQDLLVDDETEIAFHFTHDGHPVTEDLSHIPRRQSVIPLTWVLLDSQSTIDIYKNRHLPHNIREVSNSMQVSTNKGSNAVNMMGFLPGNGDEWYNHDGIANVLSLKAVQHPGYIVTCNTQQGRFFTIMHPQTHEQVLF
jgi:hypothetical protein